MTLSRRELLTASALLLAGPAAAWRAAGSEPAAAGGNPIILCWNENPYGPSPAACAAASEAIGSSCRYPDDELEPLVQTLAARAAGGAEQIATGTRSGERAR